MENKKFKVALGGIFWFILLPTALVLFALTAFAIFDTGALIIMLAADLFTLYFVLSSAVGYAELRESTLFVKFGFFLTREIPYSKIRGLSRERKFYSDSMLSLKNTLEHINIKYNRFDIISVSVVDNDSFSTELERRINSL